MNKTYLFEVKLDILAYLQGSGLKVSWDLDTLVFDIEGMKLMYQLIFGSTTPESATNLDVDNMLFKTIEVRSLVVASTGIHAAIALPNMLVIRAKDMIVYKLVPTKGVRMIY
jgi:hypothetical protein